MGRRDRVLRPAAGLLDAVAIPTLQVVVLAGLGQALCETGRLGEGLERLRAAEELYHLLGNEAETTRMRALRHRHSGARRLRAGQVRPGTEQNMIGDDESQQFRLRGRSSRAVS